MIIAIANQSGGSGKTLVASYLALLRARAGRKVLLLDADPKQSAMAWNCECIAAGIQPRVPARPMRGRDVPAELEVLRRYYNDIVIDTEGRDTMQSRAALIAARVVLVPVSAEQADLASQYQLIARLNSARMFNPGLRVLFVACCGCQCPESEQLAAIRAYASRVMSASLACTVIHKDQAAEEMPGLYREVFAA